MVGSKRTSKHKHPTVGFSGNRFIWGELHKADLGRVCLLLNSSEFEFAEAKKHLRELVKAWQDSGPNLEKMTLGSHQDLLLAMNMKGIFTVQWMPSRGGRAMLFIHPDYELLATAMGRDRVWRQRPDGVTEPTPEVQALIEFGNLTLNPHCEQLAGPCARCGNYYVKKRASQNVYCSRKCGNAATAVARTAERLKAERKDKLSHARAAMKRWKSAATRQDWKPWVEKETGINSRFLTRAVTKGDLVPPKKEKR